MKVLDFFIVFLVLASCITSCVNKKDICYSSGVIVSSITYNIQQGYKDRLAKLENNNV